MRSWPRKSCCVKKVLKAAISKDHPTHAPVLHAMTDATDHILDTSGLFCPEPVMLLHNKIRDMGSGAVVFVIATDPSTQRDIPKFCTFLGHEVLEQNSDAERFFYRIKKA